MNASQTGRGWPPQEEENDFARVIREIYRNFGADDGGEWIALDNNNRYFRVDRETESGSMMTPEEFQRGPIETPNPISRSSDSSSYRLLPGLVQREPEQPTWTPQSGSYRDFRITSLLNHARPVASQAIVNELTHDLFEYVLPEIRRLPGNSDFHFSSTDSLRPTYLGRSSDNPVGAAGATLANLGDSFVALGNALQSIGRLWQDSGSAEQSQHDQSSLEQQSRTALRVLAELSMASPLAVPFLQSNLDNAASQTQQQQPQQPQPTTANARDDNNNSNGQNIVNENQMRILALQGRRVRRYHAFQQMIDAGVEPIGNGMAATLELHISPIAPPTILHPHLMQVMRRMQQHGQNEQQQQQQSQAQQQPQQTQQPQAQQQQPQAQQQTQPQGQQLNPALEIFRRMMQLSAGGGRNETSGDGSGENSGNDTANNARNPRSVRFMPNAQAVEIVMEHIMPLGGDPQTNSASRAQSRNQSSASQQQRQEQQQEPSPPRGSNQPSQTENGAPVELSGTADHSVTLGSQSARSDRSVGSTTTEYSNNNNPFVQGPRIFGVPLASPHSQQQQQHLQPMDSILQQQLARATNPFSTAMLFLGAEPGSTTSNTSRRASVSSSTNGTQSIDGARGSASEGAGVTNNQPATTEHSTAAGASAEPSSSSSSTAAAPRTGETRGRTSSSSESDTNTGGCSQHGASGSCKRHRSCDGTENN
ncbi:hypothetical protein H4R20_004608 [Coemansia guatemalensis]|uniref:Uncharacterized protein n=1 Tax=Coemansia guatemalensis TaxID=2761395 RepID=A0A9W8HRS7_9FUNG|nr:hypothetical protein H4R20_004608 [Coemansia guatemalensis]